MVKRIGSVGAGFGANLLNIYELAAAIEDAQKFLKEVIKVIPHKCTTQCR